jgi:serine/threonine protein phosphatase PrpC
MLVTVVQCCAVKRPPTASLSTPSYLALFLTLRRFGVACAGDSRAVLCCDAAALTAPDFLRCCCDAGDSRAVLCRDAAAYRLTDNTLSFRFIRGGSFFKFFLPILHVQEIVAQCFVVTRLH